MRALAATMAFLLWASPTWAAPAAIGTLRTRNHEVQITAGTPPRYTVTDREGRVIAENATRAEIARRLPELHRALDKAIAGVPDARLR